MIKPLLKQNSDENKSEDNSENDGEQFATPSFHPLMDD